MNDYQAERQRKLAAIINDGRFPPAEALRRIAEVLETEVRAAFLRGVREREAAQRDRPARAAARTKAGTRSRDGLTALEAGAIRRSNHDAEAAWT